MTDSGKDVPGGGSPLDSLPLTGDPFSDGTLDAPNCPTCLHQMEAAHTARGGVFWECPGCGQTSIS